MSKPGAKQVMYIYNGNEATADVEFDANGTFPEPPSGTIIKRNGRPWKVAGTTVQAEAAEPTITPILKIKLTDQY